MSEKPYHEQLSETINLRVWVLGQMVWGAFLAGLAVLVVVGVLAAIYGVSLLLPPESKEAPPPMGSLTEVRAPVA